jgi:hypothetical protein
MRGSIKGRRASTVTTRKLVGKQLAKPVERESKRNSQDCAERMLYQGSSDSASSQGEKSEEKERSKERVERGRKLKLKERGGFESIVLVRKTEQAEKREPQGARGGFCCSFRDVMRKVTVMLESDCARYRTSGTHSMQQQLRQTERYAQCGRAVKICLRRCCRSRDGL